MNRCKWKDALKRSWIYKQCRKRMRILKEGWNATPNLGCSTKMSILPVPKRNGEAGRYGFQEAPVHIYGPALFETANRAILYTVDWTRRQNSWASNIAILGQGCAQRWILLDKHRIGFKCETNDAPCPLPHSHPLSCRRSMEWIWKHEDRWYTQSHFGRSSCLVIFVSLQSHGRGGEGETPTAEKA